MPGTDAVCIDASLYLSILLPDEHSPHAINAFQGWLANATEIVAPSVFAWECLNAVRQSVRQERVTNEEAFDLVGDLISLPFGIVPIEDQAEHLWTRFVLAQDLPTVYDATYLAVADQLGCELWTEDRRLHNPVHESLPQVRCASLEGREVSG